LILHFGLVSITAVDYAELHVSEWRIGHNGPEIK